MIARALLMAFLALALGLSGCTQSDSPSCVDGDWTYAFDPEATTHDEMVAALAEAFGEEVENGTLRNGSLEMGRTRWMYSRAALMDPADIEPALTGLAATFYGDAHVDVEPGQITIGTIWIDLTSNWPKERLEVATLIHGESPQLGFSFVPPAQWQGVSVPDWQLSLDAFDEAMACVAGDTEGWTDSSRLRAFSLRGEGSRLVVEGEVTYVGPCQVQRLIFDAPTMALQEVIDAPCGEGP